MAENTTTETSVETDAGAPEAAAAPDAPLSGETSSSGDVGGQGDDASSEVEPKGDREAARYRKQLRDTEAERDTLRRELDGLSERLAAMQRREVEIVAGDRLTDAADIWRGGVELGSLLGEDGHVDPEKVRAAVGEVVERHPHWRRKMPGRPRSGGLRSGATGVGLGDVNPRSWASVVRGNPVED